MIELAGRCTAHEGGDKVLKRDAAPNPESYILAVRSLHCFDFLVFELLEVSLSQEHAGTVWSSPESLDSFRMSANSDFRMVRFIRQLCSYVFWLVEKSIF